MQRKHGMSICKNCGKEYQPTGSNQKFCRECGLKASNKRNAKWKKTHPEVKRNPEKRRAARATWNEKNPERVKVKRLKQNAKRRSLGFIPVNTRFNGCEGHHINQNDVIYIPRALHRSLRHNHWTGQGMQQINAAAYQYLAQVSQ